MNCRRTILLFTRAPEAEARAKGLPVRISAPLFAAFLRGWQERAAEANAELLVVTPRSSSHALARLMPQAVIAHQTGASFGERVNAAFDLAFDGGSDAVLMAGGDCPPLAASDLDEAFAFLESNADALVLTPAADGGVNAIGLGRSTRRPFKHVAWQSHSVCAQLTGEAQANGNSVWLTSRGHDLDSASAVAGLYRISRADSELSQFRWLILAVLQCCRGADSDVTAFVLSITAGVHDRRGPPSLLFV